MEERSAVGTSAGAALAGELDLESTYANLAGAVSPEQKITAVRTLKERLSSGHPFDHDRLVPALLPWLLEPQPMLRVLVATCLLRCSSTATTLVLRPSLRPISETISRALLPLQRPGASSSSTTLRFISVLLRIYTALFLRLSPVPTEVVAASIAVLSVWVYHRAALHGTASSVPHRGRPVLDAAALGAFTSFNQSPQKGSVIRRSPSWSSSRDGSSGSEDEAGKGERHSSAQVRLDALACLRTLALGNGKALHQHWTHFLSDSRFMRSRITLLSLIETDPAIPVRIQACQTLEALLEGSSAYLAIADDRPSKASFTSLSSKLAELVTELHLKMTLLVATPSVQSQPELLLALLNLCVTLARNSPYSRMQRPLAGPFADSISPLLDSEKEMIAVAAGRAMTAIVLSSTALDWSRVFARARTILEGQSKEAVEIGLWGLLGLEQADLGTLASNLALIHLTSTTSEPLERAQIGYLSAVFRSPASPPLAENSTHLLPLVLYALSSPLPTSKIAACDMIVSPLFALLGGTSLYPVGELFTLCRETETSVRAAACRAVGIVMRTASRGQRGKAIEVLCRCCVKQEDSSVVASASWSLANCCDLLMATDVDAGKVTFDQLLDLSCRLADVSAGEKIQTNGLRCVGSLLRVLPPQTLDIIVARPIDLLCTALVALPAKVRWNAATAIGHALVSPNLPSHQSRLLIDALVRSLLQSKNLKVRIQAAEGLRVPSSREVFGDGIGGLLEAAKSARELLETEEVPPKEIVHRDQLVEKLKRLVEHLESLL